MKYAILAVVCTLTFAAVALADQPGADWISKNALKTQMQEGGYSAISVEADDGHWEGEALKDGRIVEFHADPHSGRIIRAKPKSEPLVDRPGTGWIRKDVLKKRMEAAGYSAIVVESDDGHWEGEAVRDGRIVEFHADPHTGRVTQSKPKAED